MWKKISIQFCESIGVRGINLENATTSITWRTVNDTIVSHATIVSLVVIIIEVRSDVSYGFVDGVEFDSSTSIVIVWNSIKGAVSCRQSSPPISPTRVVIRLSISMIAYSSTCSV